MTEITTFDSTEIRADLDRQCNTLKTLIDENSYKEISFKSENLLFYNDFKLGYYQGYTNQQLTYHYATSYRCAMIEIEPSTTYYINKLVHFYMFVAEDGTSVISNGGQSGTDATDVIVTAPSNAVYLAVNFRSAWSIGGLIVAKSSSAVSDAPLNRFLSPFYLPSNDVFYVSNILDTNNQFEGIYIENDVLHLPAGAMFYRGQGIGVSAADITLPTNYTNGIVVILYNTLTRSYWTADWHQINNEGGFNDTNVYSPESFIFGLVWGRKKFLLNGLIKNIPIDPISVAFNGDSVTAGNNTTYAYHMYLHETTGLHCKNYGCGGTGFVKTDSSSSGKVGGGMEGVPSSPSQQSGNNTIGEIIDTVPTTIKNFVVFGGTNDYGGSIPIASFRTAVEGVITKLYNRSAKMLFITPMRRLNDTVANSAGLTLKDYVDAIIEICNDNGVPYVDMYNNNGLNPNNATNKTMYVPDGLHPNEQGHKMIARKVLDDFVNYFTKYQ